MGQTWEAPQTCPVCGHDHLLIERLRCPLCGSAIEGAFEPAPAAEGASRLSGPLSGSPSGATHAAQAPRGEGRFGRLARLSDDQLEFVEVFLRCRGIIKNVEDMLGVSYPTVRARLNTVLETLGLASDDDGSAAEQRRARREILNDLASGRITTEEAHALLARAQPLATNPATGSAGAETDDATEDLAEDLAEDAVGADDDER